MVRRWRKSQGLCKHQKKVVRILIRDVWLKPEGEPRQTKVRIHWQTGATTEGTVARPVPLHLSTRTSDDVVERVRELYAQSKTYEQIAEHLNREGLRTGKNDSFNAVRVHYVVQNRGIKKNEGKDGETE
ncbi:MAG: hypothetical protein BMS9Abin37_1120 [Acidobacteriota bacterium]|nr:MAG: hypothetical protein BMS9Abin37_1120 [Acidobacteriota bacterium]